MVGGFISLSAEFDSVGNNGGLFIGVDTMNKQRNLSLDVLKIIAMLMVVSEHMLIYTGVMDSATIGSPQYIIIWLLRSLEKCNVNLFILISGYYLSTSEFKFSKVVLNILEVQFFSILSFVGTLALGEMSFSLKSLIKAIIPVIGNQYWFATTYISLYLLMPVLNFLIAKLNQKQHILTIGLVYVVQCIYPNFFYLTRSASGGGRNLSWFIVLYLTASYLHKYYQVKKTGKSFWLAVFGGMTICLSLSKILPAMIGNNQQNATITELSSFFFSNDSPLVYISSCALFVVFLRFNKSPQKLLIEKGIWLLSRSSFAVYLLHDGLLKSFIFGVINLNHYIDSAFLFFFIFIWPIIIYLVATLVDQPRILLFQQIAKLKFFEKASKYIDRSIKNIFN